jgi:hypothetical protein
MALKAWSAILQLFAIGCGIVLGIVTYHWITG